MRPARLCPGDAPGAVEPLYMKERINGLAIDMTNGEKSVNPLRDEASLKRSGNQKKKTHFVGLFFLTGLRPVLTGLRPVLPLGQCSKFGIF